MTPEPLTEKIGTSGNDDIAGASLEIIYALAGDDTLRAFDSASEIQIVDMAGGSGGDTYEAKDNTIIEIYENGNSSNDVIIADRIGLNNNNSFAYLVDNRHLFAGNDFYDQYVVVVDWQNPENQIEKFVLEGEEYSYEQIAAFSGNLENLSLAEVDNLLQLEGIDLRTEDIINEGIDNIFARAQELENGEETALKLTGGTAQIAYVAYYGRPADNNGLGFWNDVLTDNNVSYAPREGDLLTGNEKAIYDDIVNQFGNSEEADRLFGGLNNNRDKVNQVYQFAFARAGNEEGLDFWTEQIDNGNVTLATFALEVALGAQNEDIEILNNKIESANLFSNSIDTQEEINAYQGSSAELFGREWLDNFGATISSQAEVDSALTNLVDGDF